MSRPTDKADRYLNYGLTNRLFKSQEEYLEREEIGKDLSQNYLTMFALYSKEGKRSQRWGILRLEIFKEAEIMDPGRLS